MSEHASGGPVEYEVSGRIARITLDRPERGNGITRALVRELAACVERADLDPAVHVMLLSGNGHRLLRRLRPRRERGGDGRRRRPQSGRARRARRSTRAVIAANHDPRGTWDPMVDYAMMSRNVRGFMSLFHCGQAGRLHGARLLRRGRAPTWRSARTCS